MGHQLLLTADLIKSHLFNGAFRPMTKQDWYAFADADEGSLIADLRLGRFSYLVIFSPAMGNVQIFESGLESAWEMDLNTGHVIEL